MQTSHRLPLVELKALPAGSNQSETYRHLFGLALRNKSEPQAVDISSLPTTMIRLSPAAKAQLDNVAEKYGMDVKAAFAGLCAAGAVIMHQQMLKQAGVEQRLAATMALPFATKSPNQTRYFEQIMVALQDSRIVFAEGSTGIGKSRAMAAAAIEQAKAKKTPVVLAAPTIVVMKHLYDELRLLNTEGITFTVLPGASEFVDDLLLGDYLKAASEYAEDGLDITADEEVVRWVQGGAKPLDANTPIAHALGGRCAWLMDDLRQLAKNMPVEDFVLRRDLDQAANGEARQLLASLRDTAKTNADIIICTHAMLALGQKTQWRAMPEPCVLLIDEAHQFEQAVASVNSDQVSLYSLRVSLSQLRRETGASKASAAGKSLEEAKRLTSLLQALDADGGRVCISDHERLSDSEREQALLRLKTLGGHLASRSLNGLRGVEHYRGAVSAMVASLTNGTGTYNRVDLEFSPDRRYPSLYCGPARVDRQLRHIWKSAKGGVVLASATLYIMDATGNSRCDYLRNILAVDFERLNTPSPVIDKCIYTLPTLHLPSKTRQAHLIPPGKGASATDLQWQSAVTEVLLHIAETAKGGTLVLLTAYRDIQAIANSLRAAGIADDRLIEHRPEQRFSEAERRFRAAHGAACRPILLALGAAWTGIDLKDNAAADADDFLLTDLVIARLPVGLNRNNSMTARIERMGLHPIINEALLTLKQGLGRLIRRDLVQHRRIWLLDGRISPEYKWQGMETLTASVRRLTREYVKRQEF
jgi:ATP-dependent DNA helicase DinG